MNKRSQRIILLLDRLYTLDSKLGGTAKNDQKPIKEFDQILNQLKDDIEMISANQKDRDAKIKKYGNDEEAIALGVQIREAIIQSDAQLKQMEKTLLKQLTKPKKYDPKELEMKVVQLKLVKVALKGTKMREFGVEEQEFKGVNLGELQNNLFQGNKQEYVDELSKEEQDAMERWNLNDEHMDKQLDQIICGIDQLHMKAINIGEVQ